MTHVDRPPAGGARRGEALGPGARRLRAGLPALPGARHRRPAPAPARRPHRHPAAAPLPRSLGADALGAHAGPAHPAQPRGRPGGQAARDRGAAAHHLLLAGHRGRPGRPRPDLLRGDRLRHQPDLGAGRAGADPHPVPGADAAGRPAAAGLRRPRGAHHLHRLPAAPRAAGRAGPAGAEAQPGGAAGPARPVRRVPARDAGGAGPLPGRAAARRGGGAAAARHLRGGRRRRAGRSWPASSCPASGRCSTPAGSGIALVAGVRPEVEARFREADPGGAAGGAPGRRAGDPARPGLRRLLRRSSTRCWPAPTCSGPSPPS